MEEEGADVVPPLNDHVITFPRGYLLGCFGAKIETPSMANAGVQY
jgi:hypothetical protein